MHTKRGSEERFQEVAEGKVIFSAEHVHVGGDTGKTKRKQHMNEDSPRNKNKQKDKPICERGSVDFVHEEGSA
jgi:hypothetical protein